MYIYIIYKISCIKHDTRKSLTFAICYRLSQPTVRTNGLLVGRNKQDPLVHDTFPQTEWFERWQQKKIMKMAPFLNLGALLAKRDFMIHGRSPTDWLRGSHAWCITRNLALMLWEGESAGWDLYNTETGRARDRPVSLMLCYSRHMGPEVETEEHTGDTTQEFQLLDLLHLPENESSSLKIKTLKFTDFPDRYLEYEIPYVSV